MGGQRTSIGKSHPPNRRIFFSEGGEKRSGKQRSVKTCLGLVEISQKQGKKLGLRSKTQISPGLEKCCLRLCAKSSYEQAEIDLKTLMGISIGGSSLHRLVQKIELPAGQGETQVSAIDRKKEPTSLRRDRKGRMVGLQKPLVCTGVSVRRSFQSQLP